MSTLASFFCIIRFAKSSWGLVVSYEKKKKKKLYDVEGSVHFLQFLSV